MQSLSDSVFSGHFNDLGAAVLLAFIVDADSGWGGYVSPRPVADYLKVMAGSLLRHLPYHRLHFAATHRGGQQVVVATY